MDAMSALIGFSIAAALLTITPGIDTALVLRTATVEGPRQAIATGTGVVSGVLAWGLIAALGLGVILTMSTTAYLVLKLAGAAYLVWLGGHMLYAALGRKPSTSEANAVALPHGPGNSHGPASARRWFLRGLASNLLNPKVGVFYVSFLPQFLPPDVPVIGFSILLAAIHAAMGIIWFAGITLATRPLADLLRRPKAVRCLDGSTGVILVGFGLGLLLERRAG